MRSKPISTFEIDGARYVIAQADESTNTSGVNDVELLKYLAVPPLDQVTFGYLLRHHRLAKRLTQKSLASATQTSQKHIDKIENCKIQTPGADLINAFVNELGPDFGHALEFFKLPNPVRRRRIK
jgi:hypothetical protein